MTPALAIHDPNCSTWDTPAESGADHLVAIGYHDERIAAYLSTLRPVYDAMKRCLGQMAGLLLAAADPLPRPSSRRRYA